MASSAPPERSASAGAAHSARLVAAGILLSRIAGLVRESLLGHYFGTTVWASAFRAGLRMPNILQNMLGEGTLSASFIPVYSALIARGEREAAGRVAGAVFALLLALAGALALIGVVFAPALVRVFFWGMGPELRAATIACVRIIFPMTGVLVLSAWSLGILNSHGRFFVPYVAPVLWNAAIIATLVVFGGRAEGRSLMLAAAWGALIGGGLQFAIQLPWVLRLERALRFGIERDSAGLRQVLSNAGPAVLGRGAVQLGAWIDQFLASFLFTGAIAAMSYAQTLYVLPFSLFGMAVAAAELPALSREGAQQPAALRARVDAALSRMLLLVVPSAVGYVLIGDIVVATLYERGLFTAADTALVHLALAGYALGLVPSTASRLYASAFYALNDTRTPARIAFVRVVTAGALALAFMLVLERFAVRAAPFAITRAAAVADAWRPMGVVGLGLASGVAAWLEWALLRRGAIERIGPIDAPSGRLLRLVGAAAVAALLARGTALLLPDLSTFVAGLILLPLYALLYFALARAFGVRDALDTPRAVLRRLSGRKRNGRG